MQCTSMLNYFINYISPVGSVLKEQTSGSMSHPLYMGRRVKGVWLQQQHVWNDAVFPPKPTHHFCTSLTEGWLTSLSGSRLTSRMVLASRTGSSFRRNMYDVFSHALSLPETHTQPARKNPLQECRKGTINKEEWRTSCLPKTADSLLWGSNWGLRHVDPCQHFSRGNKCVIKSTWAQLDLH